MQAVGQSFALTGIVFFAIQHLRPQDALTFGAMLQTARVMGGEIGQAFVTTFTRVRSQAASNLIGLHVQIGDGQVMARIQAYANATHAAGNAASGLARGAALLGSQVHLQALTEGVIDCFEAIAGLTAVGLLLMVAQKAAPRGPATHRSLFAPEDAKPS
jgi:DHA2 family multidrug resistance protein